MAFSTVDTARQLEESLALLEWALAEVPERWYRRLPGQPDSAVAGETPWSVAMNAAHLTVYEERIAVPVLEVLLAGKDGTDTVPSGSEDWLVDDAKTLSDEPMPHILDRLRAARFRQVVAVRGFDDDRFNHPMCPLWGARGSQVTAPLRAAGWVATKTLQHTWEHGNAVLRTALWGARFFPDGSA